MAAEAQLRVAQLALLTGDHDAAPGPPPLPSRFRQQNRPAWRARAVLVAAETRLPEGQ